MSFYCGHCGSQNHLTLDCFKKHLTFAPPKEPEKEIAAAKEQGLIFELKPRWIGAPKICTFANLPAFKTTSEMADFQAKFHSKVKQKWKCEVCKHWHYLAISRPPSGDSSGHSRSSGPIPSYVKYFRRAVSFQSSRLGDLLAAKNELKKKVEPVREKALTQK